jgi:hypothetical protein
VTLQAFRRDARICYERARTLGLTSYVSTPVFYQCLQEMGYKANPNGYSIPFMKSASSH